MADITVFYQTKCPFSTATITFLTTVGLDIETRNVNATPGERERLQPLIGERRFETPTVRIDNNYHVAPGLSELKRLTRDRWPAGA